MKKEKIPVFVTKEEKAAYAAPKETSVAPKETDAAMVQDAMRYRWLKQQRPLVISTDNTIHLMSNKLDTYISSHKMFVNGVQVAPAQTLDELVDKAMENE
jgi:hypothetical protein